jgi:arginyl-tRNA---protein transferase
VSRALLISASDRDKARQRNEFDLLSVTHESEYTNLKRPPDPAHRFEVSLEPDQFTEEKYKLFENYQKHVHDDDDVTQSGFRRFLCGSPLTRSSRRVNGVEQRLGSFHHCYRLDGRLIAMGVLDLLPHCVSGVYFIYHQDFEKYSFGKLSALREAALAQEDGYNFYYMGYYIHSCVKMRYKNDYRPQHILDYETNQWDPLDNELMKLLDEQKYVSMSRERRKAEAISGAEDDPGGNGNHTVEESDEVDFKTPIEAATAYEEGTSLFKIGLPGMLSLNDAENLIDLDGVKIELRGKIYIAEVC